jgi:hypothetical protein
MMTATRPLSRRFLRSARTVATVTLTLLLTMGTAACSTPTAGDVPPYAVATQDDPQFENTFRHGFADVDGVRMHYVTLSMAAVWGACSLGRKSNEATCDLGFPGFC